MTTFNLTIGAPSVTRLSNVAASKYTVAPRTNEFKATVNGVECPAWTTEGRGSFYIYTRIGADLWYFKMANSSELIAARQALTITSDAYEEVKRQIEPAKPKRRRVAKA